MGEVSGAVTFEALGAGTRTRWDRDVRLRGPARVLSPFGGLLGRQQERACWEGLKHHPEPSEERTPAGS